MNKKLRFVLKVLLIITMLFAVTYVIYGFISDTTILLSIATGYYKMIRNHGNSKRCMKNILPFSQLSDKLINNWMLGSIMRSPKQILQENQKIFTNNKQNFVTMSL